MVLHSNIELTSILKTLIPISNLSKDNIELIVSSSSLKAVSKGNIVFSEGDNDDYAFYLLKGELKLISTDNTDFRIYSEDRWRTLSISPVSASAIYRKSRRGFFNSMHR